MSKSPSSVDFSSQPELLAVSSASSISCCGVLTCSCKQYINFYKTMTLIWTLLLIQEMTMSNFQTRFCPWLNILKGNICNIQTLTPNGPNLYLQSISFPQTAICWGSPKIKSLKSFTVVALLTLRLQILLLRGDVNTVQPRREKHSRCTSARITTKEPLWFWHSDSTPRTRVHIILLPSGRAVP